MLCLSSSVLEPAIIGFMKIASILFVLLVTACSHRYPKHDDPLPDSVEAAVESDYRDPENTERDEYQHPKETLEFFGIKPDMTVVEVSPGNGYFTEILAPYLAEKGRLILAVPRMPPNPPQVLLENEKKIQEILLRHQNIQKNTGIIPLEPRTKRNGIEENFADMVLDFNNIHNLVAKDIVKESFQLFFEMLKPGGVLGIVQHRVREGRRQIPKSGYLFEREVIKMAREAGFEFTGKSEINANPEDNAQYPKGVWTLPPYYRLGDEDREKYEEIGESDKMTLKFRKPL